MTYFYQVEEIADKIPADVLIFVVSLLETIGSNANFRAIEWSVDDKRCLFLRKMQHGELYGLDIRKK